MRPGIVSVLAAAHAYAFDGSVDAAGNRNASMVELAERFGVFVKDVTHDYWPPGQEWCFHYVFTGPLENVRAVLAEYWGPDMAAEYLAEYEAETVPHDCAGGPQTRKRY